jgi:spore coat polysaccharide biosynthesis protein SpsF (cytidylyltransferase family)/spore coat polysaccharide biosynthesis predicted glycosyltransferase SpsG
MNKLSAIILCRSRSCRLPNKHFRTIGKKYLIEIIIDKLLKNINVNEIYLATGPKLKNFIYEKNLKKKYKLLKFFYHKNEERINERIYELTKKIKNNYVLIVSGDCPIIENKYINYLYSYVLKYQKYDYLKINKCGLEGIDIYKRDLWPKINRYSKNSIYSIHPGYVVKKKSVFKKKNIKNFLSNIYSRNTQSKIRLSIDTQSDLDFFNVCFEKIKNYNMLNYKNILNLKKYSFINRHVLQRNQIDKLKNKIYLICHKSIKYGHGHFKRAETIQREINETITPYVKFINFKSYKKDKVYKEIKFDELSNLRNKIIIIDVPKDLIDLFKPLYTHNKILLIDNFSVNSKVISVIPGLSKFQTQKNIFTGIKYLILNREINVINNKNIKKKNYILVVPGATGFPPGEIVKFIDKNKNNYTFLFVLNKKTAQKKLKILKSKKLNYVQDPVNFLYLLKSSQAIIARHGVLTYEAIALGKKPIIWDYKEQHERKFVIDNLNKKRFINIFKPNLFKYHIKYSLFKKIIKVGCQPVIKILKNF